MSKVEDNFKKLSQKVNEFYKLDFKDKEKYVFNLKKWLYDLVDRNLKIKRNQNKERVHKVRQNVYCLDFGVNVGSEFSFFHFCVVVKEFDYTAIVVPLSTEKEDDADWKSAGNLIVPIGEIDDMPYDKKPVYAMVNQIRTVSKHRLTDYYDKKQKKHIPMTLNEIQMKNIFDTLEKITQQKIKQVDKKKTVDISN